MSQTVNGVNTSYVLDQDAELTQVLSDGKNTYLYGIGRISQQGAASTEYFLGDALGSVRQLVDEYGNISLAKSYEPYGGVLYSGGGGVSSYGFTGEWTDATGLVYLRVRYYSPARGRFLSRDVWEGDYNAPMSYNAWLYVYANPVNRVDPTGHYVFDRIHAANYAMNWDHQPGLDPKYDFTSQAMEMTTLKNQCALFASSVLYEGGVRDPRRDPIKAKLGNDYLIPYWDIKVLKAGSCSNSHFECDMICQVL